MHNIPLIKPFLPDGTKTILNDILDSGMLTEGKYTKDFEKLFLNYIDCKYAIATTSCTTGLELALRALKVGKGDEVIIPNYTYPATASVVSIVGAKGIIVDVDKETMLINYHLLESAITEKTKAIIPVSLFGNPLDYEKLNKIKKKYNIAIIEDAACAIGSDYINVKTGTLADISVFSLHPRKFITSGEGGVITTNNAELAEWMVSYKHFGMKQSSDRKSAEFAMIGTNYKLSNILAGVAIPQMNIIDKLLNKRIELANNYIELLKNNDEIKIPKTTSKGKHSYQTFIIFINDRDRVMCELRKVGIEVQIGTYSLHMHKAFENKNFKLENNYPSSEYAYEYALALPMYHEMTKKEQKIVIMELKKCVG